MLRLLAGGLQPVSPLATGRALWQQVLPRLPSRILALTTVIWHNDKTSQPITRSLIAYDR
ncbi:hypothetical protein GCM10020219_099690 [Nonomuraea dietziae]